MLDFGILISPFKLKLLWCDWFSVSYPNRITKCPQDWPEAQEFHQNSIWYLKVLMSTNVVIDVECTFEFDIDIHVLKYRATILDDLKCTKYLAADRSKGNFGWPSITRGNGSRASHDGYYIVAVSLTLDALALKNVFKLWTTGVNFHITILR